MNTSLLKLVGPRVPAWDLQRHLARYMLPATLFVVASLCLGLSAFVPWADRGSHPLGPPLPNLLVFAMGVLLLLATVVHTWLAGALVLPTVVLPLVAAASLAGASPHPGMVLGLAASLFSALGLWSHYQIFKPLSDRPG
ncbi:MAG: hypothetical protein ACYCW6_24285 [Candidatus Xenobia bacterium]